MCFLFDYFKFFVDYIFWCNQIWENSENLLQKVFYVETNGALVFTLIDGNQSGPSLKDPLQVPDGPITRSRAKKIKEAM